MWPRSYERSIRRAEEALTSIPHAALETEFGTIEYAEAGEGPPVLALHGIFGGYNEVRFATGTWLGGGFRVIAPSRFGYLGSSLPADATVSMQAAAYAALLDALRIPEAMVAGFSAGTVSAMKFALTHPERTRALLLLSGHYPQRHRRIPTWPLRLAYTDRMFWAVKTIAPTVFARVCGTPSTFDPTPEEARTLEEIQWGLFPIDPRREGAIFDTVVSEPDVDTFPLEEISAPTLMIHARDDSLARYATAPPAAARIPRTRLVTIERGGHLYIGAERRVRDEVVSFIHAHARCSI